MYCIVHNNQQCKPLSGAKKLLKISKKSHSIYIYKFLTHSFITLQNTNYITFLDTDGIPVQSGLLNLLAYS